MTVGVQVRTDVRGGAGDALRAAGSQYFVAGITERGRTSGPITVESMAEYEKEFGARVSYGFLTDDLAAYFAEGGTRANVLRVVGASASLGTLTLVDRAGSPLNTVRIDAIAAGNWSARVKVQIANGSVASTVTLTVRLDDVVVETYRNHATPAALVAAVNARSRYIFAANLGSATVAPNNNPAVLAATVLSTGTDDRAAVIAATLTAAVNTHFNPDLGPGAVAIPGYPIGDVGTALLAHADTNGRIALLHPGPADALADALADAIAEQSNPGAENGALVYPWVKIPDPDQATGTITVPPTGFAAGVRARAHQTTGPWRAPAGDDYQARYVAGVADELTATEIDQANDGWVVPVKKKGATTVELYGWRSLSVDEENFYHLTGRDSLNALAWEAKQLCEPFVFRPIDGRGRLVTGIRSVLEGIAQRYANDGGLYPKVVDGEQIDPGWSVDVVAFPEERRVEATLAARISETAELILVTIIKVAATAAV